MRWRIRPSPAGGGECAERLWRAAMPPSWPVLPAAIARLSDGLVAETGSGPVGFAAVDPAGSIPLLLVDPAWQGRGIGTSLLAAAVNQVRASGAATVTAGNGGGFYIWPGVPADLPVAVRFFASRGWRHSHDTVDLVADLAGYRPQADAAQRAASMGVTLTRAADAELAEVRAFEAAVFPTWLHWFTEAPGHDILLARDRTGDIAGTLLLSGPGADTVLAPMLGPAAGTIACVGVAPRLHGRGIGTAMVIRASGLLRDAGTRNCHIGWVVRESFYRRAGYLPWRRYAMFAAPASEETAG